MKFNIDQTTDFSTRNLYRYFDGIELPEYVKQAELDTQELSSKYGGEAFADKIGKTFPILSPASTYVSNAYFLNKKSSLRKVWGDEYTEKVGQRIKDASVLWNVSEDVSAYTSACLEKQSADYSTKHIYSTRVDDQDLEFFPVKTAEDLVKAAESFEQGINNFPFEWRFEISSNFVKTAKELGVDELPDIICKYAGLMYPNVVDVANEIWRRSTKFQDEQSINKYAELVKELEKASTTEDFNKLATVMYNLESKAGLHDNNYTASLLGDPVDKIFTLSLDKVAEMLNLVEMGGHRYKLQELKKISSEIFKEAFGVELDVNNDEQLMEVLPTMPRSDVALFEELSGLKPII